MIPKIVVAQRDFSGGQVNADARRRDDLPLIRAGARQMENWRVKNSGAAINRPGRTALFPCDARAEEVSIQGSTYRLCFGDGTIVIRNSSGTVQASASGYSWTPSTAYEITWAVVPRDVLTTDIVICFPGMRPAIARYSSSDGWSFLPFNFRTASNGGVLEPFYRLVAPGVTLQPSALTGTGITITFSKPVLTSSHVGTRMRYVDRQLLITGYSSSTSGTATALQTLLGSMNLVMDATITRFAVGDVVTGATSGATGQIYEFPTAAQMNVVLLTSTRFVDNETIVGPSGAQAESNVGADPTPGPSLVWDEEVMSDYRGWPSSVFYDQNRLGFCNFPALPRGIAWSRMTAFDDFLVGATASDPMFELAPGDVQVYHVVPGPESNEFVYTNKGVYYVPISTANPLRPGSVQFGLLSRDGAGNVQPRRMQQNILYLNAGLTRVMAVVPTGAYQRPFEVQDISEFHTDLFSSPIAIAAPDAAGTFPERYAYVLNDDGTVVVGKQNPKGVGWMPWSGQGDVKWVSALDATVMFTTDYAGTQTVRLAETLDDTQYVDLAVLVNSVPAALAAGTYADATVNPNAGSNIGNLTGSAGLAGIFDGVDYKASTLSGSKTDGTDNAATPKVGGYAGKDWGSGTTRIITGFVVIAPSDTRFNTQTGSTTITVTLYGSATGSFSGEEVSLGSATGADATGLTISKLSGLTASAYRYHRVKIESSGTFSGGACRVAAVRFYVAGETHTGPGGATSSLWFLAGLSLLAMDGRNPLGTHTVDDTGALVALVPGEDTSSSTYTLGGSWTATLEPFVPNQQEGEDRQQRLRRRRIATIAASFEDSTGFYFVRYYAGPVGPNLPTLGSEVNIRRIAAYNAGDNQDVAPPLRTDTETWHPPGRSYDPRAGIVKDVNGPLTITEIGLEATV